MWNFARGRWHAIIFISLIITLGILFLSLGTVSRYSYKDNSIITSDAIIVPLTTLTIFETRRSEVKISIFEINKEIMEMKKSGSGSAIVYGVMHYGAHFSGPIRRYTIQLSEIERLYIKLKANGKLKQNDSLLGSLVFNVKKWFNEQNMEEFSMSANTLMSHLSRINESGN